ncbi:MAG: DUF1566 domain-containing protein [Kofleriaceae bacterium]
MRVIGIAGLVAVAFVEVQAAPVHDLPVTSKARTIHGTEVTVPHLTLTPYLTGMLDELITSDWHVLGAVGQPPRNNEEIYCGIEIATDRLVSWSCRGILFRGGTAGHAHGSAVMIEGDDFKLVTLAMLFAGNAGKLAALTGTRSDNDCTVDPTDTVLVTVDGLEFVSAGDNKGCVLAWDLLKPLFPPKSFMLDVIARTGDPLPTGTWAKAPPRFIARVDGVEDRVTRLVWAAKDSGADLTWEAAKTFARDYRGGNHSDWRLPTDVELEMFAQPEGAHREKTDCTRGTSALLATPLVKLSCGLAWSSTEVGKQVVAFGFISGTSRRVAPTDKKNLRALVVRTP